MTFNNSNNFESNIYHTGSFNAQPSSNINLGSRNRNFFQSFNVNPDQTHNPYTTNSGAQTGTSNVFYGNDFNITNGKADLKSIWRDLREVKNVHIFYWGYFNQELAVIYNTNKVQYLTTDQVKRKSCTKVKGVTNRTKFREFMLATEERRVWVPRYYKSERGRAGKTLYCPLYNEEFWVGIIFTLFEEQFNGIYLKSIYLRNLKMGEFNMEMGFNEHIYTKTEYDNVYLNGDNKKMIKNMRRRATNQYLLCNCPDFKNKVESGLVKGYAEYLTKYIIKDASLLENYEAMDKDQLLHVINQHNETFSTVANNWGVLNQELNLHQQVAEFINPSLKHILLILNFFDISNIHSLDTPLFLDERSSHHILTELGDIKLNVERGDFTEQELLQVKTLIKEKILQVLTKL